MKLVLHATARTYRLAIQEPKADGRLPLAWFTYGEIFGHGWGFLAPWAQLAVFPEKGLPAGIRSAHRRHEPFWILRVRPTWGSHRHRNHAWTVKGRYWRGYVWRKSWGYRRIFGLKVPAWRRCLLDPDKWTSASGKADDWGSRPGENW